MTGTENEGDDMWMKRTKGILAGLVNAAVVRTSPGPGAGGEITRHPGICRTCPVPDGPGGPVKA